MPVWISSVCASRQEECQGRSHCIPFYLKFPTLQDVSLGLGSMQSIQQCKVTWGRSGKGDLAAIRFYCCSSWADSAPVCMQGMPAVYKLQTKLLFHMLHYCGQVFCVLVITLHNRAQSSSRSVELVTNSMQECGGTGCP